MVPAGDVEAHNLNFGVAGRPHSQRGFLGLLLPTGGEVDVRCFLLGAAVPIAV